MSPDGNKQHLCNFTALARGMNAALGLAGSRMFTSEDFREVTIGFDKPTRKGVKGIDKEKLDALLERHSVPEESFKAAMFYNVLTPERFQDLKDALAAVSGKPCAAGGDAADDDDDEEEGAEAQPLPKHRSNKQERATAPPARPKRAPKAPPANEASQLLALPPRGPEDDEARVLALYDEARELFTFDTKHRLVLKPTMAFGLAPSWEPPVPGAPPNALAANLNSIPWPAPTASQLLDVRLMVRDGVPVPAFAERLEGALIAHAVPGYVGQLHEHAGAAGLMRTLSAGLSAVQSETPQGAAAAAPALPLYASDSAGASGGLGLALSNAQCAFRGLSRIASVNDETRLRLALPPPPVAVKGAPLCCALI